MNPISRIRSLRFDTVSRRYIGLVALTRSDGRIETVRAAVVGVPGWPLERVARHLIGAARMQIA